MTAGAGPAVPYNIEVQDPAGNIIFSDVDELSAAHNEFVRALGEEWVLDLRISAEPTLAIPPGHVYRTVLVVETVAYPV